MALENVRVYTKSGGFQGTTKVVIKDFVELIRSSKPKDGYESAPIMVGDVPMIVKVSPNGNTTDYTGWVSIFLRNSGNTPVQAQYSFTSDILSISSQVRIFGPAKEGLYKASWGFPKFASHDQCVEEYKDKDFVLTAEFKSPGLDWELMETKNPPPAGPKEFDIWEKVFTNMERPDFTLVFDGQEVACHKHILAAASPVLRALTENQHREAIESKANMSISEDIGRAFVRYVYTGKLDETILKEHAAPFLELGEMYDLEELKSTAERELLGQLNLKTMVRLLSFGELLRANELFEAALKMTKTNISWLKTQV